MTVQIICMRINDDLKVKVQRMRGDSITGVRGGVKVITKIKDKNELEIY